jgi:hypothetical protein
MSRVQNNEHLADQFLTLKGVEKILCEISFFPSAVAESAKTYTFEAKEITTGDEEIDGFLVRCGFTRPDTQTGEIGKGYGRWNHVPKSTTIKGIVMTAYVAYKLVVEHEMMESFAFHGVRLLDPHKSIQELSYPKMPSRSYELTGIDYSLDEVEDKEGLPKRIVVEIPYHITDQALINDMVFEEASNDTGFAIVSGNIDKI